VDLPIRRAVRSPRPFGDPVRYSGHLPANPRALQKMRSNSQFAQRAPTRYSLDVFVRFESNRTT
jgi:hypothetical protein